MVSRRKKRQSVQHQAQASAGGMLRHGQTIGAFAGEHAGPILVFLFGAFLAILYFGHQAVPNSDFPAFVRTGREILQFQLPYSFKRLPGLGILQILMSVFTCRAVCPVFTGALLLNSLLYPFCGLLCYLIAKRFAGKYAFWIAMIAMVNPWVLRWMRHPIVELPLIFFFLLTFFLLFRLKNPRWVYLAAFAASMLRYEGAVLIPIVFLWDILRFKRKEQWKQWIFSMVIAGLCALPVILWVAGQYATRSTGQFDYFMSYEEAAAGGKRAFGTFSWDLWTMTTDSFLKTKLVNDFSPSYPVWMMHAGMWAFILLLILAAAWGIYKRQWDMLSIFIFALIYFFLHASRAQTRPRYGVPIIWPVILLWFYGAKCAGQILTIRWKPSGWILLIPQIILGIVGILWAGSLAEENKLLAGYSPASVSVPFAAVGTAILYGLIEILRSRGARFGSMFLCMGFFAAVIASSQLNLVEKVGSGYMDEEFKQLAFWYKKNAPPGATMVTTMPHVISLFVPEYETNFIHTGGIKAQTPNEFIQQCYQRKITYVAWDSRLGFATTNAYYIKYGLKKIAFLGPADRTPDGRWIPRKSQIGPLEYVGMIQNKFYPNRVIFIYKLRDLETLTPDAQ